MLKYTIDKYGVVVKLERVKEKENNNEKKEK